jgi:opacity protein-like surface antigen
MFKNLCLLVVLSLVVVASLRAQSTESATTGPVSMYAGGEISTFNPDWGCVDSSAFRCWDRHLLGLTALVDANHVWKGLGLEGEARWLHWQGPGLGQVESNYLVGPRYPLYQHRGIFTFYAKGLVGVSRIKRPLGLGEGSYFTLAPGGTAEYGLTRKVVIRAEYEYQIWTGFRGLPGGAVKDLTPNGFSFGVTYRL